MAEPQPNDTDQAPARPVFVLGARHPALRFAELLGATPALAFVPASGLLDDLVATVERHLPTLAVLGYPEPYWRRWATAAYEAVQAAAARRLGKPATVEYSTVPIRRLDLYFPDARLVVVRDYRGPRRAWRIPGSPAPPPIEVGAHAVGTPAATARVLWALDAPAAGVVDLTGRTSREERSRR